MSLFLNYRTLWTRLSRVTQNIYSPLFPITSLFFTRLYTSGHYYLQRTNRLMLNLKRSTRHLSMEKWFLKNHRAKWGSKVNPWPGTVIKCHNPNTIWPVQFNPQRISLQTNHTLLFFFITNHCSFHFSIHHDQPNCLSTIDPCSAHHGRGASSFIHLSPLYPWIRIFHF